MLCYSAYHIIILVSILSKTLQKLLNPNRMVAIQNYQQTLKLLQTSLAVTHINLLLSIIFACHLHKIEFSDTSLSIPQSPVRSCHSPLIEIELITPAHIRAFNTSIHVRSKKQIICFQTYTYIHNVILKTNILPYIP